MFTEGWSSNTSLNEGRLGDLDIELSGMLSRVDLLRCGESGGVAIGVLRVEGIGLGAVLGLGAKRLAMRSVSLLQWRMHSL